MKAKIYRGTKEYLFLPVANNVSWDVECPTHLTYHTEHDGIVTEPFWWPTDMPGEIRADFSIVGTASSMTSEELGFKPGEKWGFLNEMGRPYDKILVLAKKEGVKFELETYLAPPITSSELYMIDLSDESKNSQ